MKRCLSVFAVWTLVLMLFSPLMATADTWGITGECTWVLDGTVLTVSGDGAMADYTEQQPAPWGMKVTAVHIEDGVTAIGNYAFANCYSLSEATIAGTAKRVGDYAFSNNADLTTVTMENGVEHIGDYAFSGCSDLLFIRLPHSVTTIGEYAFKVAGLRTVQLSDGLTTIGNFAFHYCASLTAVDIPHSVVSIGAGAFYQCKKLAAVTLGNGVQSIGQLAFCGCVALTSIRIPMGVTSIGSGVFSACSRDLTIHCSTDYAAQYAADYGLSCALDIPKAITYNGAQIRTDTDDDCAMRFGFTVTCIGVERDETYGTVIGDNAMVNIDGEAFPLIGFGANVSTRYSRANALHGVDVPAHKVYSVNEDGTVTFTVCITGLHNAERDKRDTVIHVNGYVTYLDGDEVKTATTGVASNSYNTVKSNDEAQEGIV